MSLVRGLTYVLAVVFWLLTAGYAVLVSQDFIYQQFLRPGLWPLLAWFAQAWPWVNVVAGLLWFWPRGTPTKRPDAIVWLASACWAGAALAGVAGYSLQALAPGEASLACALAASAMLLPLALAERPDARPIVGRPRLHTASDFGACVLAATVLAVLDGALAGATREPDAAPPAIAAWLVVRGPMLAGMVAFLALTLVRGTAGFTRRPVVSEAAGTVLAIGALLGWFMARHALASISIDGWTAALGGALAGMFVALAVTVRGAHRLEHPEDGVASVLASFAPRVSNHVWGFAAWVLVVGAMGWAINGVTQIADWNGVAARLGLLAIGLLILGGARRVVRLQGDGHPAVFFGLTLAVLAGHVAVDRVAAVGTSAAPTAASRWAADLLADRSGGPADLYDLLLEHTNIPGSAAIVPPQVDWAALDQPPAAGRPDLYVFVIDSLRRDYLSPYNPAVTFTPALEAFARESLVFDRAFTQYGATGLSVPSIWIGGPLLHKQYVLPFAPMNALARLLAQQQYAEWISMDNILDVILPPAPGRDPLDRGVPVRDFRLCRTLDEVRGRLQGRPADGAPVFVYSLPQDIHVSVITREGAQAVDGDRYDGFHAPVASRVRRLDQCFGAFIEDLKARGTYDRSVIVVTSDHGDSLGEGGRIGHAYTLYPEIVRVPLMVHVPPALRDRYDWDVRRPAFTTDLTPTFYRLLGYQTVPPAPYFGESLAWEAGMSRPAARNRMVAASYGSVYGALLDNATRLYVVDAIQRREMAFAIDAGPTPGSDRTVTDTLRRTGGAVIRDTVEAIARQYQFTPPPR